MGINQEVSKRDLDQIRGLEDFDLIMLISDIHDHGWPIASETLCLMPGGMGDEEYLRRKKKNAWIWEALAARQAERRRGDAAGGRDQGPEA